MSVQKTFYSAMKTSDDEYISCEEEYARVRPVKWTCNKREKRQNYRQEVVESASVAKMLNALSVKVGC